jgi:hypothetical protein
MSMSVATTASVHRILRLSLILLVLLPAVAQSQSGIWGARGISRQFLVRGNQVIAIDGRGVASYDVSDVHNIRRVSAIRRDDESLSGALLGTNGLAVLTRGGIDRYEIAANGALTLRSELPLTGYSAIFGTMFGDAQLLAGAGANGLTLWHPVDEGLETIGQFATNGTVNAVAFHDDAVYVGIEGVATYVYRIGGGAEPIAVIATNARGLAVSGDTLYIAASVNGLVAYDISDDAAPRELARLDAGAVNLQLIAASGTRVFATEAGNVIQVYDAASGVPVRVATIDEPVTAIAASGTRLFVSGSIVDRYGLALETGAPLRVFDASTLSAPKLAGDYRDLAGPVSGVATDGSLAYVVDPPFFRVLDISKTAAPLLLASLRIAGIQDRVRIHGTTALIYGRGDVNVVDITNPYVPRLITTYESSGIPPSSASMAGEELVEGNPASGFHVVDFRHYTPSAQIGGLKGHYWEVIARDNAAYLFEIGGIRVLDLSNRNDVAIVKNLQLAGRAAELIDATETHPELLLVYSPTGMQLFTLANRLDPIMSGSLHCPQGGSFAASGNTAWFALPGTIDEIDITNPAHPAVTPTLMRATAPMQMAAAGRKIVIADRYSLRIYGPDTAAPTPPPNPKRRAAGR